jgi:predicted N-acetyltransferase YhbS
MTGDAVAIRDFTEADRPQVESLYAEVFGARALEAWRRRFDWQYRRSPAAALRPARLWSAECEGRVIGFLSSFPMLLQVAASQFAVLCPCDLMVSNSARGLGLGQRLIEAYIAAAPVLVNALQYSTAAERIYDRLGYAAVAAEPVMLRPRNFRNILEFRRSNRASPSMFRAAVDLPAALVLGTGTGIVNLLRLPRRARGITVTAMTSAGLEFDDLWSRLRPRFPVIVVRDRAFVQWRYLEDPLGRCVLLLARDASGAAAGHAGVMVAERRGVTFGYVLDVFADPDAGDVIDTLVAEALAYCKARGASIVSCLGLLPPIRRRVERCLWWRPRSRQKSARFLWQGDAALAPVIADAASWHLSHADGDEAFSL